MATVLPPIVEHTAAAAVAPPSSPPIPTPLEQRVVLYNVSWETYERLVAEIENPSVRLAYNQGELEIVSPISQSHERFKKLLARLLDVLTEELRMSLRSLGSTTWMRRELEKGLEAVECYYLTTEPTIRAKEQIDLAVDPPPDLALEIENTTSAIDKLGIYAALRIPEVWRFDGEELVILALQANGEYVEQPDSKYFPPLAVAKAVEWIATCNTTDETPWVIDFRRWVRENLVQARP